MRKTLIALLVCIFLVLTGCSANKEQKAVSTPKTPPVKASVAVLRGPTAIGMIKLIDEKYAPEGSQLEYVMEQSPEVLSAKLLNGELDFATIPTNMAANLYNKGVGYQIAGVNVWGVMYVVSNGGNISTWNDLKGKEISCTGQGAVSDLVFKYLLMKNGIDPNKDVHLTYIAAPAELAQAAIAGKIQISVLPEPWVTNVLAQNKNLKIALDLQKEWTVLNAPADKKQETEKQAYAQTCLVVKKEFAQAHPEIVKQFLSECEQETEWINTHPSEAGKLVEKHQLGLTASAAQASIPRCNLSWADAGKARPAVETFLKVLMNYSPQSVGGKLPDDAFYYQK